MNFSEQLRKFWRTGVLGTFLAGLFVLLPIVLTFVILSWIAGKLVSVLGPGTFLGDLITVGGGTFIGPNHKTLSYFIGTLLTVVGIWFLGVVVKNQARNQLGRAVDYLFERMPVVRSIYKPVSQVIRMFSNQDKSEFSSMSVVSCRFGTDISVDVLALSTSDKVFMVSGERRRMVYLPTSPLPMSGALVLMPEEQLIPMPAISVDELMQTYFSMGVITPEALSTQLAASADKLT